MARRDAPSQLERACVVHSRSDIRISIHFGCCVPVSTKMVLLSDCACADRFQAIVSPKKKHARRRKEHAIANKLINVVGASV